MALFSESSGFVHPKNCGMGGRPAHDARFGHPSLRPWVTHSQPPAGVLHHSDRGSQYAAAAYQQRLQQYGMTASMSRKGNCYDNAMIESWHSLLKKELIYLTKFRTRAEAEVAIFAYIEIFYNRQRVHSALDYQTPAEAEAAYQA